MDRTPSGQPASPSHVAARIAGTYLVLAALWIYASDRLLALFVADPEQLTALQSWKGIFFVLTTAALLLLLMQRALTAQRAAETEARERAILLQHYLAASPVVIYVLQLEAGGAKTIWVGESIVEILGYTPEEAAVPGWWQAHVHPDDLPAALARQETLRGTGSLTHDYRFRHKDGALLWIHDNLRATGSDGRLIGVWTDITEHKRAELALRESEDRYRSIFENSHATMLIVDPSDGRIVDANVAAAAWYGWSRDELCRKRIGEINTLSEEELRHELERANRRQNWHFVFRHRRADASVRDVEVFSGPVCIDGRTLLYSIVHDISEKKEAEAEIRRLNAELEERVRRRTAELEAANRELEAFAYSVSHDLRAPLRAVDGFSRILLDEYAPQLDAEGQRLCGIVGANTRRMGQLIDDLLTFSRLGRIGLKEIPVDMTALAESAFREVAGEEERARIDFRLQPLPPTVGDPGLLRQVWVNLIGNAVKFSARRERPQIEVTAQEVAGDAIYTVCDNGAGFDMRYADKLFKVFQRLHGEQEFPGTGLGLALAQRVVQRHGGRIWGQGALEAGASFSFTLKRHESAPGTTAAHRGRGEPVPPTSP